MSRPAARAVVLLSIFVALLIPGRPLSTTGYAQETVSTAETAAALQRALPGPRDLARLAAEYGGVSEAPRVVNPDPPARRVGQVETFWISRQNPPEHFQANGELRLISEHAYWYVEPGFQVSDAGLRRAASVFDAQIYPGVRRLVGSEAFPGIDNDPRITIFNGNVPGVAGYVSSPDGQPRSVHPYSNEREIVYLNLRVVDPGTLDYNLTLAHEFTHLVHQNVNPSDDTWVKEGLADLVASTIFPERALAIGNFFSQPDLQLTAWSDGESPGPPLSAHYQAAAWFLRYFLDRFGEDALASVLAHEGHGPANFDNYFRQEGSDLTFVDLYRDWTIANLGANRGASAVPSYRTAPSTQPMVRSLDVGRPVQETVSQFGTDFYEVATRAPTTLAFDGAPTTPVIGTQPAEGAAMWYGGRADTSVSSMTRTFDLSRVSTATLSYSVWYDIERDYDYGYVSASTDGGLSWTLLETPSMSRSNRTGNNLGVGYTGSSGGGGTPTWLRENVDLGPFVGNSVAVRFSYITDDAFVREGIAVDDVRLDAVGFADGAESDRGGWILQGWSRVGPALTQTWAVQAIAIRGGQAERVQIPIDANGHGQWSSDPVDRVVVSVSGTAPVILQRASYRFEVK